ncbi:MAG: outer membrane beta-barrel protein [Acidobacteriales bacterium]|jgi:opacity protein-like surface antigen|nr:outer membrane beta-barrel protein [Terriglobales bacterium]
MKMRTFCYQAFLFLIGLCMLGGTAQAWAQTDVALSLYGSFSGRTNGNGTIESPANSAGGIIELRHISNPLVGYEATYSYNRGNETYKPDCGGSTCTAITAQTVKAAAHEVTADWLVSVHAANLRPFVLGGVGVLFNQPDSNQASTDTSTKGVFVYGAGLDWGALPHLGFRFQYRGNLYKAPDLTKLYTSTDRFTHTAQPMIGAYFRF